jgi:hypothetical protein
MRFGFVATVFNIVRGGEFLPDQRIQQLLSPVPKRRNRSGHGGGPPF